MLDGSPKVHLHADDFWHFIRHGAIAPYLPEARVQNGVVIGVLASAAERYAKGGYLVVVDGIVGPWFLQPFRMLGTLVHYVVLRPPLELAIERCRERGGDMLADPATIAELHRQLSSPGELEAHVLETGHQTSEQLLERIVSALDNGAFRLAPTRSSAAS